jgi:hypothetical protein
VEEGLHVRIILAVIRTIHADAEAMAYEVVGIRSTPILNASV